MEERRRDRQRRELVDEICAAARRQLEVGGAGAVTWRGIAREVGMGPASLYTYFASLDELFTELILRSYASLADAVQRAVDAFTDRPVGDRLLIALLAYRRWAVDHPAEFNLIFTDQLPGFAAEPAGPTVDAQVAVFLPIIGLLAEATGSVLQPDPTDSPAADVERFFGVFGPVHGLTSLEANHHLDWLADPGLFERRFRAALDGAGAPAAADDVNEVFASWCGGTAGGTDPGAD